jgi:hypothetical protein
VLLPQIAAAAHAATLTGFAVLPADTFRPGPTSGAFIKSANQRHPPFIDQQPVQGFSALISGGDGSFFVLSDNGFGSRENSSDYLLCIYQVHPDFRTANGGSGDIRVGNIINLRDPGFYLPYPTARDPQGVGEEKTGNRHTQSPGTPQTGPGDRLLTGADLDPESFRRLADGSFWIGEEFNPALLHFGADGMLLAPPFKLAGLNSADNPSGGESSLPRSRGFEGMAISPDGKWLYPMLEGALQGPEPGLNIYTFDIREQRFVNEDALHPSYRYRLDEGATAIGDFTMFSQTAGLVIERDSAEGAKAAVKKVYRVDFELLDADGFLLKLLVADLLNISDPDDLDRDGDKLFSFPFWTIEGLVVLNASTLGIVNDNNYPLGQARDSTATQPDNNEFILIEVDALWD